MPSFFEQNTAKLGQLLTKAQQTLRRIRQWGIENNFNHILHF